MKNPFQKISVLGGGLLGGSLALALQDKVEVRLWFRKADAVSGAKGLGISGATADLKEAVKDCDLLILAVPVGAMSDLLAAAVDAGLPSTALVTDVGSVKQAPHRQLAPILSTAGNVFIGSHPMAGSEQNGLRAARADLFKDAACLLTNDSSAPEKLTKELEDFWRSLDCRTRWFSGEEHDRVVARISHLPHITAAATALSALGAAPEHGDLAGGGLRDTTRVASGNPSMWAEILCENKEAVVAELRDNIGHLNEILASLEAGDLETARTWLEQAKQLRDHLK
jgi:prephenate dehydrogenase